MNAAQANVDRLQALKSFARIIAPFDGIVTARNTDVGALINVGGAAGQELFVVSDTKQAARLRQRAADLCAEHSARHEGDDHGARTSGQDVRGDGRVVVAGRSTSAIGHAR